MARVPPGRAGRTWLVQRLGVAARAADMLDRKARVLRQKADAYTLLTARTGAAWTAACAEAETWSLRAVLLGGQAALRAASDHRPTEVTLTWATTMGVTHPAQARCTLPPPANGARLGPATLAAVEAYRRATETAVAHAVALAASRAVEAELAATRHRLRAVTDRWMPRLRGALIAVVQNIEETERAEGVGLRWALRVDRHRDRRP